MQRLKTKALSFVTALMLVFTLLPLFPEGIISADAAADTVYVRTWDELESALTNTANKGKKVFMLGDIKSETKTKLTASVPLTLNMHVNSLDFPGYLNIDMPNASDTFTISSGGNIYGNNMNGGAVVLSKGKLYIESGTIKNAKGEGKYSIKASDYSKVTVNAGDFYSKTKLSENVTIAEDSLRKDEYLTDNDVWHTKITDRYDLVVSCYLVTKNSKDDILGDGEASYDPKTKTLTLKKSFIPEEGYRAISNYGIDGLTIKVANDVTLTAKYACIELHSDTTITGNGKLTLKSTNGSGVTCSKNKLLIKNANINISAKNTGINNCDEVEFNNSNVTVKSTDGYAVTDCNGIYCTKSKITEPQNGIVKSEKSAGVVIADNFAITDKDGNKAKTVKIVPSAACSHDNLTATAATKPTCMEKGNSAYWTCNDCGKFFADKFGLQEIKKDSWVLPTTNVHDLDEIPAKAATCTTAGNKAYWECIECGKYFSDKNGKNEIAKDSWVISKRGHDLYHYEAKPSTCSSDGNYEFYYCAICQKYFADEDCKKEISYADTIDHHGHKLKEVPAKAATCMNSGNIAYWECERCGDYFSDKDGNNRITKNSVITPITRHSLKQTAAKAATCTKAGNSEYWTCEMCGRYYADEYGISELKKNEWVIPATGHKFKATAAKAATCTADGNTAYWTCENCGKYFSDKDGKNKIAKNSWVIAKKGHSWSAWTSGSYDMSKGKVTQTRTCSVCKEKETKTVDLSFTRLSGKNRYATAAAISNGAYPKTAATIILANGRNFPDALAGVPLADKYGAPILLTEKETLPADTLAEIKRLKATNVIILGGKGAVSEEVVSALKSNGIKEKNITRISGSNRFETATKVAQAIEVKTGAKPTELFFVCSNNYADALSVSAAAAKKNAPIIYLAKDGTLDASTNAYLKTVKGSVTKAYVIGGSGVISDDMAKLAAKALGLKFGSTVERIKGNNRYLTCVEVNTKFADALTGKLVCVATGEDFPDALAGGVFAAQKAAPLFLINGKQKTPQLTDEQKAYLKTKTVTKITAFGGAGAVPDSFIKEIAKSSK